MKTMPKKSEFFKKSVQITVFVIFTVVTMVMPASIYAQALPFMPSPGAMVTTSNAFIPV